MRPNTGPVSLIFPPPSQQPLHRKRRHLSSRPRRRTPFDPRLAQSFCDFPPPPPSHPSLLFHILVANLLGKEGQKVPVRYSRRTPQNPVAATPLYPLFSGATNSFPRSAEPVSARFPLQPIYAHESYVFCLPSPAKFLRMRMPRVKPEAFAPSLLRA